jgi:hypothetical protein
MKRAIYANIDVTIFMKPSRVFRNLNFQGALIKNAEKSTIDHNYFKQF